MNEIVVAFGTDEHSTRALEWAAALGKRVAARIVVFSVFHPSYVEISHDLYAELVEEHRTRVHDLLERVGHADFEIVLRNGEPTEKLLRYAQHVGSDLIVTGLHGSAGAGGFGEHGPAAALLAHSKIPFAVVGNEAHVPPEEKVFTMVVGTDGSSANADSLNTISTLAKDLQARTVPVLAVYTGASTTRGHYGSRLLHQDEAELIANRLPNHDDLRLLNDYPVDGLLEAADDVDADLIAIGTRGHLDLSDLFAGQIGRHLIARSHRPVLIAPHH